MKTSPIDLHHTCPIWPFLYWACLLMNKINSLCSCETILVGTISIHWQYWQMVLFFKFSSHCIRESQFDYRYILEMSSSIMSAWLFSNKRFCSDLPSCHFLTRHSNLFSSMCWRFKQLIVKRRPHIYFSPNMSEITETFQNRIPGKSKRHHK